jgi:hypothetical protein
MSTRIWSVRRAFGAGLRVLAAAGFGLTLAIVSGGCGSSVSALSKGDGGAGKGATGSAGTPGGSGHGGGGNAGSGNVSCGAPGDACTTGGGCCAGVCDPMSKICGVAGPACAGSGAACTQPTECCTNVCAGGKCGATLCVPNGQKCAAGSDCCSSNCAGGSCAAVKAGGCSTLGNTCGAGSDCCSGNCQGGRCASSGATCSSLGDICFKPADCCSGLCTVAAGMTAGTCTAIATTGAGQCMIDGQFCDSSGTNCCSRLCVPTSTGGHICQVAQGCRVVGDICRKDTDCCGGPVGGPGSGNITCVLDTGTTPPIGRCRNPMGCNPAGDVCGGTGGGQVNARQDCCDCAPPKFNCCKPDSNGVHRCFGTPAGTSACKTGYTGTPPCCIAMGQQCAFASECCGGTPCVPDAMGTLRCLPPAATGPTCVASGGVCTSPSDCCAGLTCNIAGGAAQGVCGASPPPPPAPGQPPPDASAPACSTSGQSCTTDSQCCYGACHPLGGGTCAAGQACTCYTVIP